MKSNTLIVAVFIVLTGINLYYMLIRERSSCRAVSSDTVLHVTEMPRVVKHTVIEQGVLEFVLSPTAGATAWLITPVSGSSYEVAAAHPRVSLTEGVHTYHIESTGGPQRNRIVFSATIDYQPAKMHAGNAPKRTRDTYHVSALSIPAFATETHPLEEWCGADLDPGELECARELIGGNIPDGISTQEKIALVGDHLLDLLDDKRGIPDSRIRAASSLETYRLALAGESEIWCSNFSIIYYLFANACGIPTRRVSAGGAIDGVNYSQHAFCESYIQEQQRWACVDLNSRILLVRNRSGQVLSTIDLADLVRTGSYDMEAVVYAQGEVISTGYELVADPHRYYLSKDAALAYHLPERSTNDLTRYLRKPRTLVIANHDISSDFRERVVLFWLWVLAGIGFIAPVIARRCNPPKRKGTE